MSSADKKMPVSHKYTLLTPEEEKFVPNMTSDVNRMEVRRNWDMLMPRKFFRLDFLLQNIVNINKGIVGSGTVEIPDWESHPMLGKPIVDDPIRNGSIYEASWTHALHCVCLPSILISPSSNTAFIALLLGRYLPPIRRARKIRIRWRTRRFPRSSLLRIPPQPNPMHVRYDIGR